MVRRVRSALRTRTGDAAKVSEGRKRKKQEGKRGAQRLTQLISPSPLTLVSFSRLKNPISFHAMSIPGKPGYLIVHRETEWASGMS